MAYREGKAEIIDRLMAQKYDYLLRRLTATAAKCGYTLHSGDVEDCLQEAFLKLYTDWDRLAHRDNLAGWVYKTAHNLMMNSYRMLRGRGQIVVASIDDERGTAEALSGKIDAEMLQKLSEIETSQDMLEKIKDYLDPINYQFLLDCFTKGLTAKELAKKYKNTEAGIYKRKSRQLKRLRSLFLHALLAAGPALLMPLSAFIPQGDGEDCAPSRQPQGEFLNEKDAQTMLMFLCALPQREADPQLIELCLDALEGADTAPASSDVQSALDEHRRRVGLLRAQRGEQARSARRLSRRALVALVVAGCLVLAAGACYALGWVPWRATFSSDSGQYFLSTEVGDEEALTIASDTFYPTGLDKEFDAMLKQHEIFIPLPTWIPSDMVLTSLDLLSDDEISTDIRAMFAKGDSYVAIMITKYHYPGTVSDIVLDKDDRVFELFVQNEQEYIVYSNRDRMNAVWHCPPYDCIINSRLSKEDLYNILHSIPKRNLS